MISCFLVVTFTTLSSRSFKGKWLFSTNLAKSATPQLQVIFAHSLVGRLFRLKCGDAETYVQHRREKLTKNNQNNLISLINFSIISGFVEFCIIYFTQKHSNIFQKYIAICSSMLLIDSRIKTCLSAAFTKGKI